MRKPVSLTVAAALVAAIATSAPALADPPPWAPAHGYRHKHKHHHHDDIVVVQPRVAYVAPYGIAQGRCDRALVSQELAGGLIGGAIGGLAGSQVGKGDGRVAATAGGAVIGLLVGTAIGRSMETVDQHCVGRVLEYAPDNRPVSGPARPGRATG